jgi:two-component system, response regulator RegA
MQQHQGRFESLTLEAPTRKHRLVLIGVSSELQRTAAAVCSEVQWDHTVMHDPRAYVSTCGSGTREVLLVDVCPDGLPQLGCLRSALDAAPCSEVIAVTAYPSVSLVVSAIKAGASNCITMPICHQELKRVLDAEMSAPSISGRIRLPSLARMEWDYIARVLDSMQGNISQAAKTLGIQRSTLQRKLKKYPPTW